jgi:hypothetical protein
VGWHCRGGLRPEEGRATGDSNAVLSLGYGHTFIFPGISLDEEYHSHPNHLGPHIPEIKPYQLALRMDKESNVPQLQFNEDGVWHDFAPEGEGALKAGPWFSSLI